MADLLICVEGVLVVRLVVLFVMRAILGVRV